jgi:hypothetical protein
MVPVCHGCKACDWEAGRAAGASSSGRPAKGHRRRWRRVRARWPTPLSRAWSRSDGHNRERCGIRPIPVWAGAAATHARLPRVHTAARILQGAQRPLPRGRCPSAGTASCHRRRPWPRAACTPCQTPGCGEAYSYACRMVLLVPAMAGVAWRGSSAVCVGAFCGNEKGGIQAPFQGTAEDGTGRSKMCVKQLYVLTVRGPYIN